MGNMIFFMRKNLNIRYIVCRLEVKQQIILLVLKRTVTRAQEAFAEKDRATSLINETIEKLEGDLL